MLRFGELNRVGHLHIGSLSSWQGLGLFGWLPSVHTWVMGKWKMRRMLNSGQELIFPLFASSSSTLGHFKVFKLPLHCHLHPIPSLFTIHHNHHHSNSDSQVYFHPHTEVEHPPFQASGGATRQHKLACKST